MNWHQIFSEVILSRGLDYHQRGLVRHVDISEDFIEASVDGSHLYHVKIKLKEGKITSMKCDCPFAFDGNHCKHMVAVLWCAEDTELINEEKSKKNEESLINLVENADEKVVRDFLANILMNDEKLLNRFKGLLKCEISPDDMKRYKNQINKIFTRHSGSYGFIDYYSVGEFATELEQFLDGEISEMVENEQYQEAFELTNDIFIKLGNLEIDDSGGETGMIADSCMEIWQNILEHCD